jgi:hypothetical protein
MVCACELHEPLMASVAIQCVICVSLRKRSAQFGWNSPFHDYVEYVKAHPITCSFAPFAFVSDDGEEAEDSSVYQQCGNGDSYCLCRR